MKIPIPTKRKPRNRTDLTPIAAHSPAMANMMGKLLDPVRTYRSHDEELIEWLKWCKRLLDAPDSTHGELQECYNACPVKSVPLAIALRRRIDEGERRAKPPRP
jgi:hypothetical protein